MMWIALLLTVFFSVVSVFAIAVLVSSYRHAIMAYGDMRRALERCEAGREFTIRVLEHSADTPARDRKPRLRLASSNLLPAPAAPSWRAAA